MEWGLSIISIEMASMMIMLIMRKNCHLLYISTIIIRIDRRCFDNGVKLLNTPDQLVGTHKHTHELWQRSNVTLVIFAAHATFNSGTEKYQFVAYTVFCHQIIIIVTLFIIVAVTSYQSITYDLASDHEC